MNNEQIIRNTNCAITMLEQFAAEYLEAAREGRLQAWAMAVHATVDMLANSSTTEAAATEIAKERDDYT